VLDVEERLGELGIKLEEVQDENLFTSLGRLRRRLRSCNRRLLLLCDEVEELIKLNQKDPALLRKLRRAMQSAEDIRSVFASTIRLWALAEQRGDTSPFLHGFLPPLYIHALADEEAEALVRQANLPSDSRPRFNDEQVRGICQHCDNHPYLIQLLCKRAQELGDLDEAVEQVAADAMVSFFFSVDFEMLAPAEQNILAVIARSDASTSNSIQQHMGVDVDQLGGYLHRLEHLGYVRRDRERRFVLANYFFRRWFRERPGAPPTPGRKESAGRPTISAESERSTLTDGIEKKGFDGRYDLVQRIGTGAMGVVYKAYDSVMRDHIAIKILRPEYAGSHEALERFRKEILLARDLVHPNILRLYHLGECQGHKYLTMKWIEGTTLAKVIRRDGALPLPSLHAISLKLTSAVEQAHAAGVIHRDIKPQNVLIDVRGEPYLTDFGLARLQGESGLTQSGLFLGTPDYASPEQANLRPIDGRSDIYALGVMMFEMATGRRPFLANSVSEVLQMHRATPPPDPMHLRPELPEGLARVILRCLDKKPDRRFQGASAMRRALEALPS
jgi:hypothetical protein